MSNNDIYWTLQTTIEYGGGFYRRLAEATLLADPNNRSRVLQAFPEIMQIYGPQTHFHQQLRQS